MKLFGAATLGFVLVAQLVSAQFKQAPLPYAYNALEGSIDAQTMEIHYSKHGAAYVANLNKAIAGTSLEKESCENTFRNLKAEPGDKKQCRWPL